MKALLVRQRQISSDKQTCGRFIMISEIGDIVMQCASLELPWLDNEKNISCIPSGIYAVEKVDSPKFGQGTFHIKNVPNRSSILIHPGNFTRQIKGCVLLGDKFTDLDKDGITDVVNSKATVDKVKKLADSFTLTIIWI